MTNQQHFKLLLESINDWNKWREKHPEIFPDLSFANLSGANLNRADLTRAGLNGAHLSEAHLIIANLSFAHLRGADLTRALLTRARLSDANLSEANLSGANLSYASLSGADLSGADLSFANLSYASLSGASLSEANLTRANLSRARLSFANLSEANLYRANLSRANLNGAHLSEAHLTIANLSLANLSLANLSLANLSDANLSFANLSDANLSGADLSFANLSEANLSGADLSFANLSRATLVRTNLAQANLTDCQIYGISAWDIQLKEAKQNNLVITPEGQPTITVDNLEVAQFIYLLLNNPKIRDVIDTIAKKATLILGRFTSERKPVLEAIRRALRSRGYLPILFDFEKPDSQDLTETVSTLAHLSRFIIADLTDPSCSPYEIGTIAHNHIKPIQPLFQPSTTVQHEFAMLKDLRQRYYWILPTYQYNTLENLLTSLEAKVIAPAEQKIDEIATRRKSEEAE